MTKAINNLLIPNVTSVPAQGTEKANQLRSGQSSEFRDLLGGLEQPQAAPAQKGVEFSGHALKRLQERNISIDGQEYLKLQEAVNKLKSKGGQDSLVITSKAAYVVDVNRGMVVTAVDKNNMSDNVFTKIDSTIFMN